jgi:hypothetical protein
MWTKKITHACSSICQLVVAFAFTNSCSLNTYCSCIWLHVVTTTTLTSWGLENYSSNSSNSGWFSLKNVSKFYSSRIVRCMMFLGNSHYIMPSYKEVHLG